MRSLRVGLLGFEGVMALDVVGPFDAFSSALIETDGESRTGYDVLTIGLTRKPFVSENGIVFKPDETIRTAPLLDTLIIPGGKGLRVPQTQQAVSEWVSKRAEKTRRIATVCTGTYGLGATGLLYGRPVTTQMGQPQHLARGFSQPS